MKQFLQKNWLKTIYIICILVFGYWFLFYLLDELLIVAGAGWTIFGITILVCYFLEKNPDLS